MSCKPPHFVRREEVTDWLEIPDGAVAAAHGAIIATLRKTQEANPPKKSGKAPADFKSYYVEKYGREGPVDVDTMWELVGDAWGDQSDTHHRSRSPSPDQDWRDRTQEPDTSDFRSEAARSWSKIGTQSSNQSAQSAGVLASTRTNQSMIVGVPRESTNIPYRNMYVTLCSESDDDEPSLRRGSQSGTAVCWQDIVLMSGHQLYKKAKYLFLGVLGTDHVIHAWFKVLMSEVTWHPSLDLAACKRPALSSNHTALKVAERSPTAREAATVYGFSSVNCIDGTWRCESKSSQGKVVAKDDMTFEMAYAASTQGGVSGGAVVHQGQLCGIHVQGSDTGMANVGVILTKEICLQLRSRLN
jgi:hypothetical protein